MRPLLITLSLFANHCRASDFDQCHQLFERLEPDKFPAFSSQRKKVILAASVNMAMAVCSEEKTDRNGSRVGNFVSLKNKFSSFWCLSTRRKIMNFIKLTRREIFTQLCRAFLVNCEALRPCIPAKLILSEAKLHVMLLGFHFFGTAAEICMLIEK